MRLDEVKMTDEKIHQMEISLTKVMGDVEHVRDRIDNVLGKTITDIFKMLNEIMPQVKENSYWVGAIKKGVLWLALIAVPVLGGVIAIAFYMIQKN